MFSILVKDSGRNSHVRLATQSHLTEYSSQGLLTLVVAARDITDEELSEWQCKYENASTSLIDRSVKLRQTTTFIECKLNLLGSTTMRIRLPLWTSTTHQFIFCEKKRKECCHFKNMAPPDFVKGIHTF